MVYILVVILVLMLVLSWLVLEGERQLAEIWTRAAHKRNIHSIHVTPEKWRSQLLFQRERRSGSDAKLAAITISQNIIAALAPRLARGTPRHDTAEAILIGFWGLFEVGWLTEMPEDLQRGGYLASGPFGTLAECAR